MSPLALAFWALVTKLIYLTSQLWLVEHFLHVIPHEVDLVLGDGSF